MSEARLHTCSECRKAFKTYSHLRRHAANAHPGKLNDIAPKLNTLKFYKYKCGLCEKRYYHRYDQICHLRRVHRLGDTNVAIIKCPLCKFAAYSRKYLYEHLELKHNILISVEEREFGSFKHFSDWKQQVENDSLSRFVKIPTWRSIPDGKIDYFYLCHRSRRYIHKGKGIHYLKSKGSRKIGSVCPASMKVTEDEYGKCDVTYTSTHVGHDNDVRHLGLTEAERTCLAGDIAQNIQYDEILKKVKDIAGNSKSERIHLITKKDLHNIAQANKPCSEFLRNINDACIVEHVIVDETDEGENGEEGGVIEEGKVLVDETANDLFVQEELEEGSMCIQTKLDIKENNEKSQLGQQDNKVKDWKRQSSNLEGATVGSTSDKWPVNQCMPLSGRKV